MRDLVDIHYPDAEIIRVVQDNLSTHSAGALEAVRGVKDLPLDVGHGVPGVLFAPLCDSGARSRCRRGPEAHPIRPTVRLRRASLPQPDQRRFVLADSDARIRAADESASIC